MSEKRVESIKEVDFSGLKVPFVAVYRSPEDFPGMYVARVYDLDKPTNTVMVKTELEDIVEDIQGNTRMVFVPRGKEDVPALVGVWM